MTQVHTVLREVAPVLASEASFLVWADFKTPFVLYLPTKVVQWYPAQRELAGIFADCGTAQFSPLDTKASHCHYKNLIVFFSEWQCTFTDWGLWVLLQDSHEVSCEQCYLRIHHEDQTAFSICSSFKGYFIHLDSVFKYLHSDSQLMSMFL